MTEDGLRNDIGVGIQYIASWLRGNGAAVVFNLMEDTATAEISRSQVWQWVRHGARLPDGREVTAELVRELEREELDKLRSTLGEEAYEGGRFGEAADLFEQVALDDELVEFLTAGYRTTRVRRERASGQRPIGRAGLRPGRGAPPAASSASRSSPSARGWCRARRTGYSPRSPSGDTRPAARPRAATCSATRWWSWRAPSRRAWPACGPGAPTPGGHPAGDGREREPDRPGRRHGGLRRLGAGFPEHAHVHHGGHRGPRHTTASGKAMLAYRDRDSLTQLYSEDGELARLTLVR